MMQQPKSDFVVKDSAEDSSGDEDTTMTEQNTYDDEVMALQAETDTI